MASKNIVLNGATYNGVESITLPTSGGGSATFNEVSDTTAQAEDVASGKYFYDALGVLTEGTASGGGGLEFETGTYTPASDTYSIRINYANEHSTTPILIMIADTDQSTIAASSWRFCTITDISTFSASSSSAVIEGNAMKRNTSSGSNSNITNSTRASYFANTYFCPDGGNYASYYWRSNRVYKWVAVWSPKQ